VCANGDGCRADAGGAQSALGNASSGPAGAQPSQASMAVSAGAIAGAAAGAAALLALLGAGLLLLLRKRRCRAWGAGEQAQPGKTGHTSGGSAQKL
jgi:hypothetical protein